MFISPFTGLIKTANHEEQEEQEGKIGILHFLVYTFFWCPSAETVQVFAIDLEFRHPVGWVELAKPSNQ